VFFVVQNSKTRKTRKTITNQVGSVRPKKKELFVFFVFFVVHHLKTRKARKTLTNQVGSVRLNKKELFVCFRVFRGSSFKDTKDTKGTKDLNKSSRVCPINPILLDSKHGFNIECCGLLLACLGQSIASFVNPLTHKENFMESKMRELGPLQVAVEGSNLNRAINQLKRHMAREGVMKELKRRRHYEKPSIVKKRKQKEAARRRRKEARRRPRFVS
jgi:small subunit ribosomal protein S21